MSDRGKRLDSMLERIKEVWAGSDVGPRSRALPGSWSAAGVDASFERAAEFGDGWIAGGSGPEHSPGLPRRSGPPGPRPAVRASPGWSGSPTSPSATVPQENAERYLGDYYAWLGEEIAGRSPARRSRTPKPCRARRAYEAAGCDELIIFPASADAAQVELLADAAAERRGAPMAPTTCRSSSSPTRTSSRPGSRRTAAADGFWLKIAKKGAGVESVDYAEALEVALCFGWIDSQKSGFDEKHFLQRFTPRRPRGRWSQINREKAEALIAPGRMRPAGLAEVEAAKADGRWEAAYEGQRTAEVPADLQRASSTRNKAAREFFAGARRRQPLRDPLPPRGGEEAGDPRAPPAEIRRHARARREDPQKGR